ncbi:hypothetical protein EYF80_064265 [Liparis tanakae]|uniref:Uncharacterized protein n=1 Tax=Liparis tanakae TaxID=230148 RepID=A0A4Z2EAN7_9TELE|nr:hypothetical protein EYF80_064265 [Liparis tanakae]
MTAAETEREIKAQVGSQRHRGRAGGRDRITGDKRPGSSPTHQTAAIARRRDFKRSAGPFVCKDRGEERRVLSARDCVSVCVCVGVCDGVGVCVCVCVRPLVVTSERPSLDASSACRCSSFSLHSSSSVLGGAQTKAAATPRFT